MRRGSMVQDQILPIMKSVKRRTVYTKGKPLWFTAQGEQLENCYVIGIAGGSASGKTSVAKVSQCDFILMTKALFLEFSIFLVPRFGYRTIELYFLKMMNHGTHKLC